MLPYLLLFIAGFAGGFIAGLIGIGGGIIYVLVIPAALHHLGVPPTEIAQYTIANSLFAILVASSLVNYQHFKQKIYVKELILIGTFSSISSILSLKYIVNTHHYTLFTYNLITLVFIIFLFINTIIKINRPLSSAMESPNTLWYPIIGILGGLISSFSGLGGGIVIIPFLVSFLHQDIKKSSIISSGVIMLTAFVSTIYNLWEKPVHQLPIFSLGYIVLPISLALIMGVLLTSTAGVAYSRKLSSSKITLIYSMFLFIVILKKTIELFNINF